MNLARVKAELAAAVTVAGIANLDAFAFVPADPVVPCFYAGEAVIDPQNTFGTGSDSADIKCRVLVSSADDADGQALLDEYLSRSGPLSIRAALMAARGAPGQLALNGEADDLSILRIDGYRMFATPNQAALYGAEITVRVIGS